ncbi:MAG: hypothetical protein IPL55_22395 [Saprospiraceae bacterium]|jgi:hypothetical protein|nr:hypothetical protein [Saprospiraceae bacterium]MBL0025120.1 hypothetical protein [Saprospiraceae bacterium]
MKKYIFYFLLLAIFGAGFGFYKYNQPHKETSGNKPDIIISPAELLKAYESDESAADKTYLDKIIETEGTVKAINEIEMGSSLTLDSGSELSSIICEFESKSAILEIKEGDRVKIKGFCSGKLMDVILVRCSLSKI